MALGQSLKLQFSGEVILVSSLSCFGINGSKASGIEAFLEIEIAIQWRGDMCVFTLMFWNAIQFKRNCIYVEGRNIYASSLLCFMRDNSCAFSGFIWSIIYVYVNAVFQRIVIQIII